MSRYPTNATRTLSPAFWVFTVSMISLSVSLLRAIQLDMLDVQSINKQRSSVWSLSAAALFSFALLDFADSTFLGATAALVADLGVLLAAVAFLIVFYTRFVVLVAFLVIFALAIWFNLLYLSRSLPFKHLFNYWPVIKSRQIGIYLICTTKPYQYIYY